MNLSMRVSLLQQGFAARRRAELLRAVDYRESDPIKAAYHTGVADGHNNVVRQLSGLLSSITMAKEQGR